MNLKQIPNPLKACQVRSFSKHFIVMSALALASTYSFAQSGFDFGLKGELQSSSLINLQDQAAGNELNFKDRMGGSIGIGAGYSFTKHIGAEIDILSSSQGTEYTGKTSLIPTNDKGLMCNEVQNLATLNNIPMETYFTAQAYLSYMKIPILFRYNMNNTKRVYFSLFLGPQFDFLSSATYKINGTKVSNFGGGLNAKDVYSKTETDGVFGLGLGVNITKNFYISGHLRFDFGFGDAEAKSATETGGAKFYNSKRGVTNNATGGGLITVGYKLLKKEKEEKKKKSKSDIDETGVKTKTKTKTSTTTAPASPATMPTSPR